MGLVSSLLGAISETNDEVHGQRLLSHVQSAFACFESMDRQVLGAAGLGYLQTRSRLLSAMANWTREGRIRIARQMQDQARQALDTDVAGSYAKWMAGAWLESGERHSAKARLALDMLDMYAVELQRVTDEVKRNF